MIRDLAGTVCRRVCRNPHSRQGAVLVAKLRHARDARHAATRKCEGRKPVPEEVVVEARRLARKSPKTGRRRSLRVIAAELAALGHIGPSGMPYHAGSIRRMVLS